MESDNFHNEFPDYTGEGTKPYRASSTSGCFRWVRRWKYKKASKLQTCSYWNYKSRLLYWLTHVFLTNFGSDHIIEFVGSLADYNVSWGMDKIRCPFQNNMNSHNGSDEKEYPDGTGDFTIHSRASSTSGCFRWVRRWTYEKVRKLQTCSYCDGFTQSIKLGSKKTNKQTKLCKRVQTNTPIQSPSVVTKHVAILT
jgi:hypothetical protein